MDDWAPRRRRGVGCPPGWRHSHWVGRFCIGVAQARRHQSSGRSSVAKPALVTDIAVVLDTVSVAVVFPVFVDAASGGQSSLGSFELQACLPAAQFASTGSHVAAMDLLLQRVMTMPAGSGTFVWHAVLAPFGADGRTPDASSAYELRAITPLLIRLAM